MRQRRDPTRPDTPSLSLEPPKHPEPTPGRVNPPVPGRPIHYYARVDSWHRDLKQTEAIALADAVRAASDVAGLGITVVALDREPPELLYASRGATQILGVEGEVLKSKSVWDFVAERERSELEARRTADGELASNRFETIITRPDGTRVPIEVAVHRTKYLNRSVVVTFFTDVSQRKAAVAALKESEARFRTLVEGAPDGVAIIRQGCFTYVNPAAVRLLGAHDAEDVVGKPLSALLEPADADRATRRIDKILQTEQRLDHPAEYKSRRADGQTIYVEISSIPIDWKGQPAVLGFARDVTERKAMQARLLHKDRLAAVGALSAGLAHEINNPLSYVLLNLQYIDRELEKLLGARESWQILSDRLQDAMHGAERVAAIVRDLRIFSRTDDGVGQPVDLAQVVDSAIRVAHSTVRHSATLVRDIQSVGAVLCNPQRIEQVVLNLLINAAQALNEGDTLKDRIVVRLYQDGNQAVLAVSDTGPGMSEQDRQRIFEPFFTTKPAGVGTGLGLSICRNIVEGAGGSLSVTSKPRQGACFEVRLPISDQPASYPPEAATAMHPRPARSGRILIIDDEPALRATLAALLSEHYEVHAVAGPSEALELLSTIADFDMVLCDVMMPGNTGIEMLEAIRERHAGLTDRLVFMTGGTIGVRAQQFLEQSTNRQLRKPFMLDEVHRLFDELALLPKKLE